MNLQSELKKIERDGDMQTISSEFQALPSQPQGNVVIGASQEKVTPVKKYSYSQIVQNITANSGQQQQPAQLQ